MGRRTRTVTLERAPLDIAPELIGSNFVDFYRNRKDRAVREGVQ
jgi:hypothetical protein